MMFNYSSTADLLAQLAVGEPAALADFNELAGACAQMPDDTFSEEKERIAGETGVSLRLDFDKLKTICQRFE